MDWQADFVDKAGPHQRKLNATGSRWPTEPLPLRYEQSVKLPQHICKPDDRSFAPLTDGEATAGGAPLAATATAQPPGEACSSSGCPLVDMGMVVSAGLRGLSRRLSLRFTDDELETALIESGSPYAPLIACALFGTFITALLCLVCDSVAKQMLPILVGGVLMCGVCTWILYTGADYLKSHGFLVRVHYCVSTVAFFVHITQTEEIHDADPHCISAGLLSLGLVNVLLACYLHMLYLPLSAHMYMAFGIWASHTIQPLLVSNKVESICFALVLVISHSIGTYLELSLRRVFLEQHRRRLEEERNMHMHMAANLRLNHMIKGKCGTANGLSFGILAKLEECQRDPLVAAAMQQMQQVRLLLNEAEWWCHRRQLFVQLEAGTYISQRTVCDVCERLAQVLGPDGIVPPPCFARVDVSVLSLTVEEALSNARKYREPGTRIDLRVSLDVGADGRGLLHVEVDNENRHDLPPLTKELCARVVDAGYKTHSPSAFSDGVGLGSAAQAAKAIGGRIWLSTHMAGGQHRTVFHVLVPAESARSEEVETAVPRPKPGWGPASLPEVATAAASVDDSIHAGGADLSACDGFVCIGLDDSELCRILHELIFSTFLRADMSRSFSVGETAEEMLGFVDIALGLKDRELHEVAKGQQRAADVVLLDHNLHFGDVRESGMTIARRLRERGFGGVVALMSGTTPEDLERMEADTDVDLVFSKNVTPQCIADRVREVSFEKVKTRRM